MFKVLPNAKSACRILPQPSGIVSAEGQETVPAGAVMFYAVYDAVQQTGGHRGGSILFRLCRPGAHALRAMTWTSRCITGIGVISMRETPGIGDKILTDQAFLKNFEALDVQSVGRPAKPCQRRQDGQARHQDKSLADRRHRRRHSHFQSSRPRHQRIRAEPAAQTVAAYDK